MSRQEYQDNDRREQEQLEIIRALVEDATKDTTLWLQDDPSAEERVHVLAIQTGLADLTRIVERRMERRKLPKDAWEYSQTVSEVLSRLEKARKLRGNIIVGRGLGRLTERLPQELPGAKARGVSQAPAPPHDWHEELRRIRKLGVIQRGSKDDYLGVLKYGDAWEAVQLLAQTDDPLHQENRINNLWRMYPGTAEQLGLPKLPASQVKPAASSSVESRADAGTSPPKRQRVKIPPPVRPVSTALTSVSVTKAPAPATEFRGGGMGYSAPKASRVPHDPPMYFPSDLWPQTNVILLEAQLKFPLQTQTLELCRHVASEMTPLFVEAVKAGKMKAANVVRENGGGMEDLLRALLVRNDPGTGWGLSNQAYRLGEELRKSEEWLALARAIAENSAESAQNVESKYTDRRAMVDAYIEEVRRGTGKRITRKDIWTSAGYRNRTEFERWQRQDACHRNQSADANFARVFRDKPHLK